MKAVNSPLLLFFLLLICLGCGGDTDEVDDQTPGVSLEFDGNYNGIVSQSDVYIAVWQMTVENGLASGYINDGSSVSIDFHGTVYEGGKLTFKTTLADGTLVDVDMRMDQNGSTTGNWSNSDGESGSIAGSEAITSFDGDYSGKAFSQGIQVGSWQMTIENGSVSGEYTEEGEKTPFYGYIDTDGNLSFRIGLEDELIVSVKASISNGNVSGSWNNTDGLSGTLSGISGDNGDGPITTEPTTSITLSIPTLSMITDIGISTNRVYFTDTNELAVKFVIKNGETIVKDTISASSNVSAIARSFHFSEIYDFSVTPNDNFAKQVHLNIEGFSSNGTLVSKTAYSYIYTFVPTKIELQIDGGTGYVWENFAFQNNHQPDINDFYVGIPEFDIETTWPTECGDNDPDAAIKANILLIEWNGPIAGTQFSSSGVVLEECGGSVTMGGPSGQFSNGNFYSVSFTGYIGSKENGVVQKKQVSGTITQALVNDDQNVREHITLK